MNPGSRILDRRLSFPARIVIFGWLCYVLETLSVIEKNPGSSCSTMAGRTAGPPLHSRYRLRILRLLRGREISPTLPALLPPYVTCMRTRASKISSMQSSASSTLLSSLITPRHGPPQPFVPCLISWRQSLPSVQVSSKGLPPCRRLTSPPSLLQEAYTARSFHPH